MCELHTVGCKHNTLVGAVILLAFYFQVQIFLRDSWLNTLRTAIRSSLLDVGKGWFNMEERSWEVYQISKLAKFMQLVKFAMQVF